MPLDHISVGVGDVKVARAFYDAVLAPLGIVAVMPVELNGQLVGLGYGDLLADGGHGHPTFWVQLPINGQPANQGNGVHIAFAAANRAAVDNFYLAAMAHSGSDDGAPGLRSEYHPSYYGAFVRDPFGNKIEACAHGPE
jgi:catechol 2,3-dioxygenase-like lactoylglutathione lyase family enzyme